ncbi:serine-rich adhesin for platelets isoform X2 [Chironomus tepperi]|uniref:serine-rich adhesin for platelets isoform X2 n=1 Tax=Chironomus tepperi TaxID=113505 RepID=UPI00391F04DE
MHINEMEETTEAQPFSIELIISSISLMTLVSILALCMCCKRRNQKSSANAPHRSLPDIPIVETAVCDNNSELYATVGDKVQEKAQSKSPLNPKKLVNISQNSSMSQADDSSPYARVRSPQHAYDKLKKTEHPYAQVIQPMTTGGIATVVLENVDDDDDDDDEDDDETTIENPISHRESSNNDLLSTTESHLDASAAISGRISASQELPYMTPPIITSMTNAHNHPQHFSGDSQDSSKGYTSISVREPLANIIAQTNQQNAQRRRREIQDSHNNFYATVSDDSDEMYAAIEDPNNIGGTDLYTSGSETYAQIQAPMTVSVEINPPPAQQTSQASQTTDTASTTSHRSTVRPNSSYHEETSQIDALKNIHSRQASSSSCTSSVGNNIGSPKPEKRQANSPLPPTPQNKIKDTNNNSNKTRQDVEGMYAKVMKKNKLSSVPFESTSPVLPRHEVEVPENTVTEIKISSGNEYETIDKKRHRNNRNNEMINYSGYETIPADRNNNNKDENVSSIVVSSNPHYAQIQEKTETIFVDENIPQYETLKLSNKQPLQQQQKGIDSITTDSDYDPNYEIVVNKKQQRISSSSSTSSTLVDDGYSQIGKKLKQQKDFSDDDESIPGYSTIKKPENDYSSIGDEQRRLRDSLKMSDSENDRDSNLYSSIPAVISPSTDSNSSDLHLDYEQITSTSITPTTVNNNFELLSESSMTETSIRYVKENPYERLHNEKSPDVESISSGKGQQQNSSSAVDDFFKV